MTPERIAEIRERESKATKGPWTTDGGKMVETDWDGTEHYDRMLILDDDQHVDLDICECIHGEPGDAMFISRARQDVPDLLAALDAATKRAETAEARVAELEADVQTAMHYATDRCREGGLKGGSARAAKLTPERRSQIASQAAKARWSKRALIETKGGAE